MDCGIGSAWVCIVGIRLLVRVSRVGFGVYASGGSQLKRERRRIVRVSGFP